MSRVHTIVEGSTEEKFVGEVLRLPLSEKGIYVDARRVITSKKRAKTGNGGKGGMPPYAKVKSDIQNWLKEDRGAYVTTMFDLYALASDFPGMEEVAKEIDPYKRVNMLEKKLAEDIGEARFLPYIQLHELEALLFSDPAKFSVRYPQEPKAIAQLCELSEEFSSPELINHGYETAPSKRILRAIPTYNKVGSGSMIANAIGLSCMRQKCPHFDQWVTKLENLLPL